MQDITVWEKRDSFKDTLTKRSIVVLEDQRKFNQEDYLFIHLSPCSLHSPAWALLHVPSLHWTDQILHPTLPANHVSTVKLTVTNQWLGAAHYNQLPRRQIFQDPSSSTTTSSV